MKDFSFEDLASVELLFTLPEVYIRRALTYPQAQRIARLALNETHRYEGEAVRAVKAYFEDDGVEETPPPVCECPPANGLRWHHTPVTWSYNSFRQSIPAVHLIRQCIAEIEQVCSIRFKETGEAECNICITNEPLDGRGGTLGITYVPVSGDRMSACGPMCGNIVIDTGEFFTEGYLKTVLMHELLHAIGRPHSNDRMSIMYPSYLGVRGLGESDIRALRESYPLNEVAA